MTDTQNPIGEDLSLADVGNEVGAIANWIDGSEIALQPFEIVERLRGLKGRIFAALTPNPDTLAELLGEAWLKGFLASGEGFNGEYPFEYDPIYAGIETEEARQIAVRSLLEGGK